VINSYINKTTTCPSVVPIRALTVASGLIGLL